MTKPKTPTTPKDPKTAKQERLEKALRANLLRRKQVAGRKGTTHNA
ncbi:MAG: hypothetical protein ACK502_10620 [Alphaproteobacteria bacterium]